MLELSSDSNKKLLYYLPLKSVKWQSNKETSEAKNKQLKDKANVRIHLHKQIIPDDPL